MKILVKNNLVIDKAENEFEVHPDMGTWQDCSDNNVQPGWIVNSDNTVTDPNPAPTLKNYKVRRRNQYRKVAELGNVLDALFKKEAGDSTEWDAIVTARQQVKTDIPKE